MLSNIFWNEFIKLLDLKISLERERESGIKNNATKCEKEIDELTKVVVSVSTSVHLSNAHCIRWPILLTSSTHPVICHKWRDVARYFGISIPPNRRQLPVKKKIFIK